MENEIYHKQQIEHIYRSTEVFIDWLEKYKFIEREKELNVLDMACGCGANTMYMANRFKDSQFIGMDINEDFINYGNMQIKDRCQYNNCKLLKGDWFNLDPKWINKFDGIISFQTLSSLPEYETSLRSLSMINPNWIAISSLFYEGDIDYTIKLKDYYRFSEDKEYEEMYYNIYSLKRVQKCFERLGYNQFDFIPFDIDIDIPKTDSMDIGTYTIKTEDGKRIQISGGLMMPWYFVVAYK